MSSQRKKRSRFVHLASSLPLIAGLMAATDSLQANHYLTGSLHIACNYNINEGGESNVGFWWTSSSSALLTVRVSSSNGDVRFCTNQFSSNVCSKNASSVTQDINRRPPGTNITRYRVIRASHDGDANDERVTLTVTATGAPNHRVGSISSASCQTTIRDDEAGGTIEVTPSGALTIAEAESTTLSVHLAGDIPKSNVTVSLSKTNSDVTLSPASLTFTPSNRSTAKTVTVSTADDSDRENDSDTITLSASGGLIAPNVTRAVTIVDDDVNLELTTTSLALEEGKLGTFGVRLNARPSHNVTVTVTPSSSLLIVDADTRIATNQNTMTFDRLGQTNAWNQYKTVRVTPKHDDDAIDGSHSISLSASGGNVEGKTATVTASVTDDDEAALEVTESSLSLDEGGQSGTFSVRLDTRPSANVTVNLTTSDASLIVDTDSNTAGNQTTLLFDRYGQTNAWNRHKTVTVSAADDDDIADGSFMVNLRGAPTSGDYAGVSSSLTVAVADDDDPVGTIDITPEGKLQIDEGDASGTNFSVSLSVAPKTDVEVSLSKTNADLVLFKKSLTFTVSNYSTPQSVTITAADDDDTVDDTDNITIKVTKGRIVAPTVIKAVSIIDVDPPPGRIVVTRLVSENFKQVWKEVATVAADEGYHGWITVQLSVAPKGDVTISLSNTNPEVSLDHTSLTFNASNYQTRRGVKVSAVNDDDTVDDSDTITLSATGKIDAPDVTTAVTVWDDDRPGFDLSDSSLTVEEEGHALVSKTASFGIRLAFRPTEEITATITASDPSITIDTKPARGIQDLLTFSPLDHADNAWNQRKNVIVMANHDDDANDESFDISISGAGGKYDDVTASIAGTIIDNEDPPGAIVLSPSGLLRLTEEGSGSLSVSLRPDPSATALKSDVTISSTSTSPDLTITPSSLTFTSSNYSAAQNFSVLAAEDADLSDDYDKITLEASGGIVASPQSLTVIVTDSDRPSVGDIVLFNPQITPIAEGDSVSVGISLSKPPIGNATLSLSSDLPDVILSPSSLTFTSSDHTIAQPISIMARQDDNATDEIALIWIEISGGGLSADRVITEISIIDDDKSESPPSVHNYDGTLIIAPEGDLEIDEGEEGVFDIRLSAKPVGDVPVRISNITNILGIGVSRKEMTFTPSNWDENQTIRVTAHKDADKDDSIHTYLFSFEEKRLIKYIMVNDTDRELLKAQVLALPPPDSGDDVTLRIRCRQPTPCIVAFDCAAQLNGSIYRGSLPDPIPAYQARSYTAQEIQDFMGGKSWAGKGRLECSLRGDVRIGAQVWTRSGHGVLVNNSALIRSVRHNGVYRADIESIPSPDSSDESNIRIRCNSDAGDCLETSLVCYLDDGERLAPFNLGRIDRRATRHLQSEEIASSIGYRWEGMGLGCEVGSKGRFTVQVLTRTGGGGALVNNSATGR